METAITMLNNPSALSWVAQDVVHILSSTSDAFAE
jgi:hypothetical protein